MELDLILECEFARTWVHFHRNYYESGTDRLIFEMRSSSYCSSTYGVPHPSFQEDVAYEYLLAEDKKKFRNENSFFEYPDLIKETDRINQRRGLGVSVINKILVKNGPYICPTTGVVWRPYLHKRVGYGQYETWVKNNNDYYSEQIFRIKRIPEFAYSWDYETLRDTNRVFYTDYMMPKKRAVRRGYTFHRELSCSQVIVQRRPVGTFLPPLVFKWNARDQIGMKNPRSFLYEKKEKPKKSFFKKYISRHLTRVRKLRPISSKEVSFFRSWLGVKELAALAN